MGPARRLHQVRRRLRDQHQHPGRVAGIDRHRHGQSIENGTYVPPTKVYCLQLGRHHHPGRRHLSPLDRAMAAGRGRSDRRLRVRPAGRHPGIEYRRTVGLWNRNDSPLQRAGVDSDRAGLHHDRAGRLDHRSQRAVAGRHLLLLPLQHRAVQFRRPRMDVGPELRCSHRERRLNPCDDHRRQYQRAGQLHIRRRPAPANDGHPVRVHSRLGRSGCPDRLLPAKQRQRHPGRHLEPHRSGGAERLRLRSHLRWA